VIGTTSSRRRERAKERMSFRTCTALPPVRPNSLSPRRHRPVRRRGSRARSPPTESGSSFTEPGESALGGRRRSLLGGRELHDGVSHVCLHDDRGYDRPHQHGGRVASALGSWFTVDCSYMNARTVRPTSRSRSRQWMTHNWQVLVRSVRKLRLRGPWAPHHVVPGGNRHH
jgi:hypothetical protein